MADMETISCKVTELEQWKGLTDYRLATVEQQRQEDIKQVIRLEAEVGQVDRKVSRIEGGIEFLKWSVPISITLATSIGGFLVWLFLRVVGVE